MYRGADRGEYATVSNVRIQNSIPIYFLEKKKESLLYVQL